jgi:hypothetical protein
LVPFGEYVSTLKNSKKSATYARALTLASASYEKGVRKGVEAGFDGVCTREMLESKLEVKREPRALSGSRRHKPAKVPKAERRDSVEFARVNNLLSTSTRRRELRLAQPPVSSRVSTLRTPGSKWTSIWG